MAKIKVLERSDRATSVNRTRSFMKQKNRGILLKDVDLSTVPTRDKSWRKIVKQTKSITENVSISIGKSRERFISVFVHLIALLILSYMIVEETNDYNANPTGTAVENDMYPVQEIHFPAVAICNINILSRERVYKLSNELWGINKVRKIKNLTREKVQDLLKYMGHLYTFTEWETVPGDFELLDKIFILAYGSNYMVPKIMERIIPYCRKAMRRCSWAGQIRSCEELFTPRWTQDGSCCTFNYVRWTESFSGEVTNDFSLDIKKTRLPGNEYGLRVFLNPEFDDDYYNIMAGRGVKILFYTATDYPDGPSGGLKEVLISPGTENFLRVKGTSFYSSPDVINYDKNKRRCLFSTELQNDFEGTYSYSQCLMLCRTRDIHKICGCIPFFYPYPKDYEHSRDCTIVDLKCLRTYRSKWWSVKPMMDGSNKSWTEKELPEESLGCDCLPTCESVEYAIFHTGSKIRHYDIEMIDFVPNYGKDNVTDDTILLNMSFEGPTIVRLRQDVLFYWYELMSAYGGLCSLFLGISILTPVELIYQFCSRKWSKETMKKTQVQSAVVNSSSFVVEVSKFREQPIYWKEIFPHRRRY